MRVITISQITGAGEAMFDGFTDTQTETADLIEKTFDVGGKNCVAIFNNYGITATLAIAGGESQEVSLIRDSIRDWWDYFFAPSRIGRDTVFYFPTQAPGTNATLSIAYAGGTAKCGLCVTGLATEYLKTLQDVEVGIDDYSRIATDEFGQTYLAVGNWAKRAEAAVSVLQTDYDLAYRDIINNRALATIFDYNEYTSALESYHTSEDGLQCMVVYGFTEDFYLDTNGPNISKGRHEAQGLV